MPDLKVDLANPSSEKKRLTTTAALKRQRRTRCKGIQEKIEKGKFAKTKDWARDSTFTEHQLIGAFSQVDDSSLMIVVSWLWSRTWPHNFFDEKNDNLSYRATFNIFLTLLFFLVFCLLFWLSLCFGVCGFYFVEVVLSMSVLFWSCCFSPTAKNNIGACGIIIKTATCTNWRIPSSLVYVACFIGFWGCTQTNINATRATATTLEHTLKAKHQDAIEKWAHQEALRTASHHTKEQQTRQSWESNPQAVQQVVWVPAFNANPYMSQTPLLPPCTWLPRPLPSTAHVKSGIRLLLVNDVRQILI